MFPVTAPQQQIEGGVLSGACAGSAAAVVGRSRAIAVVRGPSQVTGEHRAEEGRISVSISRAPFAIADGSSSGGGMFRGRGRNAADSVADDVLAAQLSGAIERTAVLTSFPQLQYDIGVEIVSSDGLESVAVVHAATAALMHAGVQTADLVGATYGLVAPNGDVWNLENAASGPEEDVEDAASASPKPEDFVGTLLVLGTVHTGEVLVAEGTGCIPGDVIGKAIATSIAAVSALRPVFASAAASMLELPAPTVA